MKVCIATRFSRRHEANDLAQKLKALGHTISCRWIIPAAHDLQPAGLSGQAADAERQRFALEDDPGGWTNGFEPPLPPMRRLATDALGFRHARGAGIDYAAAVRYGERYGTGGGFVSLLPPSGRLPPFWKGMAAR